MIYFLQWNRRDEYTQMLKTGECWNKNTLQKSNRGFLSPVLHSMSLTDRGNLSGAWMPCSKINWNKFSGSESFIFNDVNVFSLLH